MPAQIWVNKDIKKLRTELLGPSSSCQSKKPEVRLLDVPKTSVRRDIEINLDEEVMNSLDNMEPNAIIRAIVEFSSKMLEFRRRIGGMLQKELKDWDKAKMAEDVSLVQDKYDDDKAALAKREKE